MRVRQLVLTPWSAQLGFRLSLTVGAGVSTSVMPGSVACEREVTS